MMKESKECKIVQDLLQKYIKGLTDSVTNNFIEKHIANCCKCEQILKNMSGDTKLERILTIKENNALKKFKFRRRLILVLSICIIILISVLVLYFRNNYRFVTNEYGETRIERFTFDKNNIFNTTNIIMKSKKKELNTKDGYIYLTTILTFNEEDICVAIREKLEGYKDERIEEEIEWAEKYGDTVIWNTNTRFDNGVMYYNNNMYNGRKKSEVLKELQSIREVEIIKEY